MPAARRDSIRELPPVAGTGVGGVYGCAGGI